MKQVIKSSATALVQSASRYGCKAAFLTTIGLAGLTTANAQIQFPVGLPAPKVGDIAKYRTVDLWNGSELSTTSNEIIELTSDNITIRNTSSTRPAPTTVKYTREWQACRSMKGSDAVVCAGALKFPLQSGNKHAYEKAPWLTGEGHTTANCEVKAEEKVTVPGGTFDTVRTECSGFWNRVFNGSSSGRVTEAYWYAPSIHRVVKVQYADTLSSGQSNTKTQTELTEFTAGK